MWVLGIIAVLLAYQIVLALIHGRKTRRWQQSNATQERLQDVVGSVPDALDLRSNRR